jgi:hypothetical protein
MHMRSPVRLLSLLPIAAIGLLAGCASDAARSSTPTNAPPTTAPTTAPTTDPADGDAALVRIGRPGELPRLVIGGDGWVYSPTGTRPGTGGISTSNSGRHAAVHSAAAVAPPAPPAAYDRRRLTPAGVRAVLDLADRLGLLAAPGVYPDPGVTDMESIEVTVGDGTSTYVHTAYALGFATETGARKNLQDFVTAIDDLPSLVGGGEIGPAERYAPSRFRVEDAVTFVRGTNEPAWPTSVPVSLGCTSLPVDQFPAGTAGVYLADVDGTPTRIAVIPHLPGDDCP